MLQLRSYTFSLPFEYPFTISKGTKTHQSTLIVSLGLRMVRGYGEAPAIAYYNVTAGGMAERLESVRGMIERYALTDPQRFWHFLHHLLPGAHFLTAALDIAGWDLFSRLRGKSLSQMLNISGPAPLTDYTIGMDDSALMVRKLQARPWPVYKIKISSPADIDRIAALRKHTDAPFRVDANEALDPETAVKLLPELSALGVEMLEQPLPKAEWEAMEELKAKSTIPLYADESCVEETDVALCRKGFHGINIKLVKCGGITPALRMIASARSLGLGVMLGSMNESSVGTAAVAQMMPLADLLDADGPMLLKQDLAEGLVYRDGAISVKGNLGTGVRFAPDLSLQGPRPQ